MIGNTIALIQRVGITWWFNYHLDEIWVSHHGKSQTTPIILHNEECYPPSSYVLNFVPKVGKVEGGNFGEFKGAWLWLWDDDHLYCRCFIIKDNMQQFYLTCDHFRDMTQPTLTLNLVLIGKWSMYNRLMMLFIHTKLYDIKVPPYHTTLGSREYLILEPRSTPFSTLISSISNSLILIRNCYYAQASNAWIHWMDNST